MVQSPWPNNAAASATLRPASEGTRNDTLPREGQAFGKRVAPVIAGCPWLCAQEEHSRMVRKCMVERQRSKARGPWVGNHTRLCPRVLCIVWLGGRSIQRLQLIDWKLESTLNTHPDSEKRAKESDNRSRSRPRSGQCKVGSRSDHRAETAERTTQEQRSAPTNLTTTVGSPDEYIFHVLLLLMSPNGPDQWLAATGLSITLDAARETIASGGYALPQASRHAAW